MKWLYLIVSLIAFGMLMCRYEIEKASILFLVSSAAYNCHDILIDASAGNSLPGLCVSR